MFELIDVYICLSTHWRRADLRGQDPLFLKASFS